MEAVVDGDDSTKVGSVSLMVGGGRWGAPHCNWGSDNSRRTSDPSEHKQRADRTIALHLRYCNEIASRRIVHTTLGVCLFVCRAAPALRVVVD